MAGLRVAISATFTAEPLREPLEFFFGLLRWESSIEFAPFGQIFQSLLDPQGVFARNRDGVNILLFRAEDLTAPDAVPQLLQAIGSFPANHPPLLIRICPSSGDAPSTTALESQLRAAFPEDPLLRVLPAAEQDRLYPVTEVHDARTRTLGAIPFTSEYFTALGASLSRGLHRLQSSPFKVIALDCDDTLWSGVCGEDGPTGVVLDGPRLALQQFMAAQEASGRLLAIASKNNEEDVLETFRRNPGMPLGLHQFAARRINWAGKAVSLRALASELNLSVESFVFVDDNPKETAEVAAELPGVVALALPSDPNHIPQFLEHVWAFDSPGVVTAEDRRRTAAYASEARRTELKRESLSLADFIQSLQLETDIQPLSDPSLPRAAQLTQRTNQMNFSTRRRTEGELREFLSHGSGFTVSVRDRFGDYGLVGLLLLEESEGVLLIDTFLLSCRALGRGVEHRMLQFIGQFALARGAEQVLPLFERTPRNTPAQSLLAEVPGFSAVTLASFTYLPSTEVLTGEAAASPSPLAPRPFPPDYGRIAELRHVSDILAAIRESSKPLALSPDPGGEPPRTDLERHLCSLWADLLNVPRVQIHDNFFDLGGHSLLAVQMVSRLHRELGIDLPLEAVYTGTLTVAELAQSIELFQLGAFDDAGYASLLSEVENLTDEEAEALLAREWNGEPRP